MFDVNKKQYILSLSTGKKAYFYYGQGSGILVRWQSEEGKWQEPVPAAKNGVEGFSTCLDRDNGIHLIYQDLNGNIIYLNYSGEAWFRKPVLRSRNMDTGDKQQLQIVCGKNGIYAFYILEYIGKKYIAFQDDLKDSDSQVTPKTIDQAYGFPTYKVLSDNTGKMSIFYRTIKDGKKISGFRTYDAGSLKWSSFQPLPSSLSELAIICAAASMTGGVHLCLQKSEGKKYQLLYYKFITVADNQESMILAESEETFSNIEIYADEACTRIFWANKEGIFCCTSYDNGNNWDTAQKLNTFDMKDVSCFSYMQNTGGKAHEVQTSVVPGSFGDAPKLAFLNIPSRSTALEDSEAESLRKTIAETLKLLTGNINDLRNASRELYKRLDGLDAAQQQLELDMSKFGIRDKFIENDMGKIKSELDVLKARMDDLDSLRVKPELDVLKARMDDLDTLRVKSELDVLKARMDSYDTLKVKPDANQDISNKSGETSGLYTENIPLMPGAGFNSITTGFLKGLKK